MVTFGHLIRTLTFLNSSYSTLQFIQKSCYSLLITDILLFFLHRYQKFRQLPCVIGMSPVSMSANAKCTRYCDQRGGRSLASPHPMDGLINYAGSRKLLYRAQILSPLTRVKVSYEVKTGTGVACPCSIKCLFMT
jgi:hypothetical protein